MLPRGLQYVVESPRVQPTLDYGDRLTGSMRQRDKQIKCKRTIWTYLGWFQFHSIFGQM